MPRERIGPALRLIRDSLAGRVYNQTNRYQDELAPRPYPPPIPPPTSYEMISDNYYCNRDARRLSLPATDITPTFKLLTSGASKVAVKEEQVATGNPLPKPGKPYVWKPSTDV